jgi:hypothetical protein
MHEPRNNYALQVEHARHTFAALDFDAMCARFGLTPDAGGLTLRFLGRAHRVGRDGRVTDEHGRPASFGAAMAIYDLLGREGPRPELKGEFVPITALHGIRGTQAVHEDLYSAAAQRFAGRCDALEAALRARGGRPWGKGDVSYIVDVFDFFPVCVRFWDADEEFPASLQFLWDANATAFLYYETLWYVMDELIEELERAVG